MSARTLNLTDPLLEYLRAVGVREDPALTTLREETANLEQRGMQISPEQGALMGMLVKLMGAKRVLEVGTFTGYSALAMARALPEDGHVTCLDVSEEWTAIARRHWDAAGVGDRITLRLGPAMDSLDQMIAEGRAEQFDLAFIDADKTGMPGYHERCLQLVRTGGALLFDNVLWGGSVVDDDDHRDDTEAIRALNAKLHADERVDVVLVPVGDGLFVARKR